MAASGVRPWSLSRWFGNRARITIESAALALALTPFVLPLPTQAAPADFGVVLLHGKWGGPMQMQALARDLDARGYWAVVPEAAWSGRRLYDKDYPAALREIQSHADALRKKGARIIIIAGQSMGANAAVAFAASGFELSGLALLAPGHFPEFGAGGPSVRASQEKARSMTVSGHEDEIDTFTDFNQGKFRDLRMKASVYWSYFNPEGLGALTRNLSLLQRPLPMLLVMGMQDPLYPRSRAIFEGAPAHPHSSYAAIDTDHLGMPERATAELVRWLEAMDTR